MSETTEAVRAQMTYHDREYESRTHSHDSLSFHDGDMAALLEDWALPIAEERDALKAEVERLRAMLSVPDGVERHRGAKTYRFGENPRERRLSDAWHDENTREGCGAGLLAWVLGDGNRPASISARDEHVAASVVQWLGTPVGALFLHDIGYRFDRDAP